MNGYSALVGFEIFLAAVTFVALLVIRAPYGRHTRPGWGPTIARRPAWIAMEVPAVLVFLVIFLRGDNRAELVPLLFLAIWQAHYINRTFVYPFRVRGNKPIPIVIPLAAFGFNGLNAYLNARWVGDLGVYPTAWLLDARFIGGVALFAGGMALNIQSDGVLMRLRRPGESGYRVPRGGLFRWVSCPNYLGEIVAWIGWAVATWSPAGLAFALYTAANLVPRALAHHRWYLSTFADYPRRRALVPGLL